MTDQKIVFAAVLMLGLSAFASVILIGMIVLYGDQVPAALGTIAGGCIGALGGLLAHPATWRNNGNGTAPPAAPTPPK